MSSFAKHGLKVLGVLLLLSGMGFQGAPTLVLYYKFDETAGNTAADSSGNGFNGTWTNRNAATVTSSTAVAPNVLNNQRSVLFSKPNPIPNGGAFVTAPNNAAYTFTTPFSAMAWINPVALNANENANNRGSIVHKWDYGTSQLSGWSFERELDGRISFTTGSTTVTDYYTTAAADVAPNGVWTHVAVVWDGANKSIYINGTLRATKASALVPHASTATLRVGTDDYNRNFYGNIDEVKLFSGALTAAQVMSFYQGVDAPTNLVATPGPGEARLTWTNVPTATSYNIYRSGTTGGPAADPYVLIGTSATNSYVDLTATFGSTYYYVVRSVVGTLTSANSNEAACTPTQPQIIISPTAIMVAENGGTATFTVTLVTRPTATVTISLASSNPAALLVNGPGGTPAGTATLTFLTNQPLTQTVTATGVERYIQGPNLVVPINFTNVSSTDPLYPNTSPTFPRPVSCTIIQDVPGLVINPAAGLATTNGGPAITFTVSLATQTIPANGASLAFSVSDPNIATVAVSGGNPAILNNQTNVLTVTVTPLNVDTTTTYIAPYTININMTGSTDPGYAALGVVQVPIFTETSLPPIEHLWKCGLMGVEGLMGLAAIALWRRQRRARKS